MRKLYLGNGDNQFKFADTTTEIHLNAFDDDSAATLTADAKVRIKNESGYLLGVSANITENHATITSGQLAQLPVGSYLLELWDTVDGGTAIYPSDGFLALQINENVTGLSGGLVSSITVDDFIQQFSGLSQQLKQEVADAVANGVKGDKGDDGLSAYQVAVINGYQGSQAEWLASLIGAKGDKGEPGNYVPETFTNLAAIQAKYPNGANGIMIAADNGHKYIWTNSTWTDAGVYQSVGIADSAVGLYESALFDKSNVLFSLGKCVHTFTNTNAWQVKEYTVPIASYVGATLSLYIKQVVGNVDPSFATMYFLDSDGTRITENTLTLSTTFKGNLLVPTGAVTLVLQLLANGATAPVIGNTVTWTGINILNGLVNFDDYINTHIAEIEDLQTETQALKDGYIDFSNSPLVYGALKADKFVGLLPNYWTGTAFAASTTRVRTDYIVGDGKQVTILAPNNNIKCWLHKFDLSHAYISSISSDDLNANNFKGTLSSGYYYVWQFGYLDNSVITINTISNELFYVDSSIITLKELIAKYMPEQTATAQRHVSSIKSIAHQGYNLHAPNNTIPAVLAAAEHGFDYVEGDIHFTSDGVGVICHNDTIDATSDGTGLISSMTLATLKTYDFGSWKSVDYTGTRIPTFEEWLVAAKTYGLKVILDKADGLTDAQIGNLMAIVKKYGMLDNIIWIAGSNPNTNAGYVLNRYPEAHIIDSSNTWSTYWTAVDGETGLPTVGTNSIFSVKTSYPNAKVTISCGYAHLTVENIALFRNMFPDVEIITWTIDDKPTYAQWLPYVDGVFSNFYNNEDVVWPKRLN